ncbi:MAG: hypothetical protein CMP11_06850 [Zetaproteobacteria bacterium]|nr:hypothetical protein [Pseudobdellovibrionaceae bacterium]|tara:strand:+ start:926 stop:1930 length:1005 start_codon:yes stop_codon:yes gene_type:complete
MFLLTHSNHKLGIYPLLYFFLSLQVIMSQKAVGKSKLEEDKQIDYSEMIALMVDKSRAEAVLTTLRPYKSKANVLGKFTITMGKNPGDKLKTGDNKTPEGIYFPLKKINTKNINPQKYGNVAIPINYPNPYDLLQRKTGSGIWLHGAGDDNRLKNTRATEGCIAFYNSEMLKLTDWLQPESSVIIIANDMSQVNDNRDVQELYEAVKAWEKTWKNKEIKDYMTFYADNFTADSKNKQQYKEYKKRVFSLYDKIELEIKNIRIITHPKYSITLMNQNFVGGNRYFSYGRKILYWKRESSSSWKIVREIFHDKEYFNSLIFNDQKILSLKKNISKK